MDIVQLPFERHPDGTGRAAMRRGLLRPEARPFLRLIDSRAADRFCATCAVPIESGIVWRGEEAFCSVECSLGGNRPA